MTRREVLKATGAASALLAAGVRPSLAQTAAAHDIVIVGGGSAGAVLARRLSADPARSVLLLEAGPVYAPANYPGEITAQTRIGNSPNHDWGYQSVPGVLGRPLRLVRGKVLGGSSAVNGAVATRATRADHDRWTTEFGLSEWGFDACLSAYKSVEQTSYGDDAVHGRSGPFPIHQLGTEEVSVMQRAFVEACRERGYPLSPDFNGPAPAGVSPYPMNTRMGERLNTGMVVLDAATRARPNLTIRGGAEADAVLFEGTRAVGVRLANGESFAAGEVVLAAGTYGSAAVLLRSGVGPAGDLRALGVRAVADLPVGRRLQDHPFSFLQFAAVPEALGLGIPPIAAMLRTSTAAAAPGMLDINVTAVHFGDPSDSPTGATFMLGVALTQPTSVGSLRLQSLDPREAPLIDVGFFRDQADLERLVDAVQMAREVARAAPMSALIDHEMAPGAAVVTRAALAEAIPKTVDTYHHPTSTCAMGTDPATSVVGQDGRVHGLDGLLVADASVMPATISVPTNVTTLMIAERIAGRIAG